MKILAFSDLHGNQAMLSKITTLASQIDPDMILCAGDFTNFGELGEARAMLSEFSPWLTRTRMVHGNCDGPEVIQAMQEAGVYAHAGSEAHDELTLCGYGDVPITPFGTHNEVSESDLAESLTQLPLQDALLLSHTPPRGACDVARGNHVGSTALAEAVQRFAPRLVLCGHIHDAAGWAVVDTPGGKHVEHRFLLVDEPAEQTFQLTPTQTLILNLAEARRGRVHILDLTGRRIQVDARVI